MANCHEIFTAYNSIIKLGDGERSLLGRVRDSLREKMSRRFASLSQSEIGNHTLIHQSQGSYVMDTIIKPVDDDFDLDDGVYFLGGLNEEQRPTPDNFHKWVLHAVGHDENYADVTDKDTCVRVRYKEEKFHIDLPIYYTNSPATSDLAHKADGWTISHPVEFIEWFEEKVKSGFQKGFILESRMFSNFEKWTSDIRKEDAQLRRIVRYLKGWADHLRGEMPPGIVMTILAAENFSENDRDDIALRDTLVKIKETLDGNGCKCLRPTTPKDEDLFAGYSFSRKKYFMDRLETFVSSATQAVANPNQKASCLKWQKHLGLRFPCSLAKDEIEGAQQFPRPAIIGDTAKSA